jgi:hypothetical protein
MSKSHAFRGKAFIKAKIILISQQFISIMKPTGLPKTKSKHIVQPV